MAVKNSGKALLQLRTLFDEGAICALSDGQLLERLCRQAWKSRRSFTRQRRAPFLHRLLSLPKES